MSRVTERPGVWDEDHDSFDDFAAVCRWYKGGLRRPEQGDSTRDATVCSEERKTFILIMRLDDKDLRDWFGLERLLWRIREEVCHPATSHFPVLESQRHVSIDSYLFRSNRKSDSSRYFVIANNCLMLNNDFRIFIPIFCDKFTTFDCYFLFFVQKT